MSSSLSRFRRTAQILGLGALLASGLSLGACEQKAPKTGNADQVAPGKLSEKPADFALGSADAPVQVVEYASMTCTHCAAFSVGNAEIKKEAVFPSIKAKYIDTGKVRWILREFPLDQFAGLASMAVRCIAGTDAKRYYAAVDLVFSHQKEWAFSTQDQSQIRDNLANLLKEAGLGRAQFDACVSNPAEAQRIQDVQKEAVDSFKINSTPTFIINGAKYEGELKFERFEEIVAPLLPKG